MGGVNVKNTIVEQLMAVIAPHPCFGCGKVGSVLCNDCKYDITHEPFVGCILCARSQSNGICSYHESPIAHSYVVSTRTGVLKGLIDALKFHHVKSAARSLAEVLHETLPLLPASTVLVPIPTVKSHVRQRGYDQVDVIVRHLARLRSLPIARIVKRQTTHTQHLLNKKERALSAHAAFSLVPHTNITPTCYLLIDDIITTGATVNEAARLLAKTGAKVFVGALAYQPLD